MPRPTPRNREPAKTIHRPQPSLFHYESWRFDRKRNPSGTEFGLRSIRLGTRLDNSGKSHATRVEENELRDAYDSVATWFGVFDGDDLIACYRACGRLHGYLELEHYHPVPDFIEQSDAAIEGTRLAVRKEYRSSPAVLALARFEFGQLLERGCEFFFTTGSFPRPGALYARKFGLMQYGEPFRYDAQDPNQVFLFFANRDRLKKAVERLTGILG
uniref:Acetyltransferase (GNAT) domain-containing protein n=1 Tax=Candidatus Kentrum sp. UNK TaxID=2126344 RepID=A0A451AQC3_9GAMM|nr:MAG: Acetyltransferase (GNAT) domain-containing protein [Candidatus Kentron sp. UNK]VFK73489.1 MAG: Acetyltransferase (GNAT) domain-containing protein [Candidatus Kentron sp. UNK]